MQWSKAQQTGDIPEPRDDHTLVSTGDGSYLVFGGFVNGSRRNDVYTFSFDGKTVTWGCLIENHPEPSSEFPAPRASHCAGYSNGKMYVIGGENEDHTKLNDFWCFDVNSKSW